MFRSVCMVAVLAVAPSAAAAQITTYIAPPRDRLTPQMVATADSARRDSVSAVAMTNMKAWVDSAAGVAVPSQVGDTAQTDSVRAVVTTFTDGSVAPNTASQLPALTLFGLATLAVGAAMLLRRPRS